MKGFFITTLLVLVIFTGIGLYVWNGFKEEAKTNEIKALKEQVMHSIYIDSVRTRTVLDSLAKIVEKLHYQDQRLDAYNKAVRAAHIQTRKQNEALVIELDSLRHLMDGRPEY